MDFAVSSGGGGGLLVVRERSVQTEFGSARHYEVPDPGIRFKEFRFPDEVAQAMVGGVGFDVDLSVFQPKLGVFFAPSYFLFQRQISEFNVASLYQEAPNRQGAEVSWRTGEVSLGGVEVPELEEQHRTCIWYRSDDTIMTGKVADAQKDRDLSRATMQLSRQGDAQPKFSFGVQMEPLNSLGEAFLTQGDDGDMGLQYTGVLRRTLPLPGEYLLVPMFCLDASESTKLSHYSLYKAEWVYVGERVNLGMLEKLQASRSGVFEVDRPATRRALRRELHDFVRRSGGYQPKIEFVRNLTEPITP